MKLRASLRTGLKSFAATIQGLGSAILLTELILTFVVPPPLRYLTSQAGHILDSDLGWLPVPNARRYTINRDDLTHSLDLRFDEIKQHKASRSHRVIYLGDSHTFGNGVDQREPYPARLQRLLSDRTGDPLAEFTSPSVQPYDTE